MEHRGAGKGLSLGMESDPVRISEDNDGGGRRRLGDGSSGRRRLRGGSGGRRRLRTAMAPSPARSSAAVGPSERVGGV